MESPSQPISASAGPRQLPLRGVRAGHLSWLLARPQFIVLGLVLIEFLQLWPYRNFAGDDAYITFRFARNLAEGGGFAFNAGEPTYGSTAPLWALLIAAVHRAGLSVPDAAHALNWISALSSVVVFWRLCLSYLGKPPMAALAVLLFALDPWWVRWSLSGMENGFALLLLMSAFLIQLRLRNSGRTNWLAPLLSALAALCRPEMALLAGLLALDNLLYERSRRAKNLAAVALAYAVVLLPWLWYAQHTFGSPLPNTIAAKLSKDHDLALTLTLKYMASFWSFQALALIVLAALAGRGHLRSALRPRDWGPWFLPVAWGLALPAFYIVGGAPVSGRYMMFALPGYLLLGVRAWSLLADFYPRQRMWIGASVVSTLALLAMVQYRYCWYVTQWPQGMDPHMIDVANRLHRLSAPGDVVAADQIGVIGYFSELRVLDIYGLVSPEILPYRRSPEPNATWKYLRERAPQYLFVIDDMATLTARDPGYRSLTLVEQVDVQREGAGAALGPTRYYLYRTHWEPQAAAVSAAGLSGL
jgi:hypothetical protein